MAGELTEKLQDQGELIAKVLCDMTGSEYFERVEFLPLPTGEKGISITIQNEGFGEWPKTRVEWFPEEYLSKSEAELVYELNRRHEEERRQKEAEERAEKEAEEREKEEAAKKRYQLFPLDIEYEGTRFIRHPIGYRFGWYKYDKGDPDQKAIMDSWYNKVIEIDNSPTMESENAFYSRMAERNAERQEQSMYD